MLASSVAPEADVQRKSTAATENVRKKPLAFPTTLDELVREARKLTADGMAQEDVIDWVYSVCSHFGIRVRHDQHEPHPIPTAPNSTSGSNVPSDTESEPGDSESDRATPTSPLEAPTKSGKVEKKKVLAPIARLPDGSHRLLLSRLLMPDLAEEQPAPVRGVTVGRLILSGDKRGGGESRGRGVTLYYECNGVVLDARTWRILSMPPGSFNLRPAAKSVDLNLGLQLYDVIRVDDGTVLTLYCWEHPTDGHVWALSSSNGYDVSSYCWIGMLTYAEIFYELATQLYPEFVANTGMRIIRGGESGVTRLMFDNLSPDSCYTIGFRHHNFHPMTADPERMWQIQHTLLTVENPIATLGGGLPCIPNQIVFSNYNELLADVLRRTGAVPAEPSPENAERAITMGALLKTGENAMARARAFVAGCAQGKIPLAAPGSQLSPELHYGYILRSRDPKRTAEYSDVLVETPLLARIRKITYERAPNAVRGELTPLDRLEYSAMRAFLTAVEKTDFLALYPGWVAQFQAFDEFVNNVIHLIVHAMRQRAMSPATKVPIMRSATGHIAQALMDHILQHENFSAFSKDTEKVIRDYVVDPSYAFLYLRAMHTSASQLSSRTNSQAGSGANSQAGSRNVSRTTSLSGSADNIGPE
jgi:hypothetical protein